MFLSIAISFVIFKDLTYSRLILKNQYVRKYIPLWYICRSGFSFIRIILNNVRKLTFLFQILLKIRENVPWPTKFKYIPMYSQYPRKYFSGKCFKGALSGLWQSLATESPLKKMKMLFILPWKLFSSSRYLNFCFDFLVMWKNGLIKKIRLISKFMTSQPG